MHTSRLGTLKVWDEDSNYNTDDYVGVAYLADIAVEALEKAGEWAWKYYNLHTATSSILLVGMREM